MDSTRFLTKLIYVVIDVKELQYFVYERGEVKYVVNKHSSYRPPTLKAGDKLTLLLEGDRCVADYSIGIITEALIDETLARREFILLIFNGPLQNRASESRGLGFRRNHVARRRQATHSAIIGWPV